VALALLQRLLAAVLPVVLAEDGVKPAAIPGFSVDQTRLDRLRAARMPAFDRPLMFDTPEADAVLAALEVFPPDNPWNLPVDQWPVAANSRR
jgi:hypothetical protein